MRKGSGIDYSVMFWLSEIRVSYSTSCDDNDLIALSKLDGDATLYGSTDAIEKLV